VIEPSSGRGGPARILCLHREQPRSERDRVARPGEELRGQALADRGL
jgi:hypothetical protein